MGVISRLAQLANNKLHSSGNTQGSDKTSLPHQDTGFVPPQPQAVSSQIKKPEHHVFSNFKDERIEHNEEADEAALLRRQQAIQHIQQFTYNGTNQAAEDALHHKSETGNYPSYFHESHRKINTTIPAGRRALMARVHTDLNAQARTGELSHINTNGKARTHVQPQAKSAFREPPTRHNPFS